MPVSPLTPKSKRSAFGKSIAQNCSDNLDLIDQDQSGDLDHAEVETLLAAMGLQGDDSKNILLAIFRDGGRKTNHLELTEAILDNSNLDQETLEVMLGRVALFGKVFRRLDANGDGQLSLSEIIKMMEMLNIDTKLAADMMAFLDADDSGEVTWQEFVRGVCSNQFKVLFPEITLEALVDLPSSLQWDKFVSEDEQVSAIKGLPTVEKTLYWVLSLMYGSSSHRRISPEDDEDLRSLLHSSDQVVKRLSEKSGRKSGQSGLDTAIANVQEPAQPLTLEREALPSTAPPCMAHVEAVSKGAFAVSDIPALVKTMNQKTVVVVTRKQPKHPSKVQPATLRLGHAFSGTHTIVVRKEAKDPTSAYARPASVQLKVPMPALPEKAEAPEPGDFQLVHFPVAEEMPPPTAAPPVLQKRRSSISSLQGAGRAVSNMLNGITSAFGMSKETASKEPKVGAMSVAQAASYIRSMDVKVNKAHVLTPQKRRALWMCMYGAVLAGCLAGVGAAFLAHALNSITSGIVDEEEDYVAWNVISAAFSLIWSMAEMVVCCIAALVAAVRMTRICGINLVPMDKERAMLAGSLARCALELGHPSVRTFGINPYKRVNKYLLLVYALIYMGSRGITKFFIKLLVKKVAPRTFVKAADMAPLVIEVLINVLFNFITVRYAMSEVMICSIGPSATVEVTSQLIKAHRQTSDVEEPLSDRVKLLALRAVGVSITYKMQMHPNSRVLLNYVVELFADEKFVKRAKEEYGDMLARHGLKPGKSSRSLGAKSQASTRTRSCCGRWSSPEAPTESLHEELADLGLDDEDMFFNGLSELNRRDALFACSLLVLALMINGRIDRTNWAFIQRASRSVEPPLEAKWSNVLHLVNAYVGGRSMNADMFHAVFQPSMTQSSSATCCDYLREGWRYVLDYTNCC